MQDELEEADLEAFGFGAEATVPEEEAYGFE